MVGWVAGWLGGWVGVWLIIMPLRGPSDKMRSEILPSAIADLSDRAECGNKHFVESLN